MSHQATTRRAPLPTANRLECPLASLGRNSSAIMNPLGGHHQLAYHHPLSSSPLDPQVYQMSRKSPNLSIDADDIIYTSAVTGDAVDGLITDLDLDDSTVPAIGVATVPERSRGLQDIYQISRSSSQSSLELERPSLAQPKASTFELHSRRQILNVPHQQHQQQQQHLEFATLQHLMHYEPHRDAVSNGYLLHESNADAEDSSDAAGGGVGNGCAGVPGDGGGNSNSVRLSRHQGGRCSVPSVNSPASNGQFRLEKKMDALFLSSGLRGLPLGSEANHFNHSNHTNERFYLDDGLRTICNYGNVEQRIPEPRLLHHRSTSPSETSGSDRYVLNRTSSPANAFNSSGHMEAFTTPVNGNVAGNLVLEQRFQQSKVKSLSDGLCNLGRFSPSLDQGYATLVSPSPTGHHPNTITTHSIVHHPPTATMAMTSVAGRRHADNGPPPWGKRGPARSGPYFDRLPDEAVVRIFSWFDSCELCNVARVCRRFEQLAWRPTLWKIIQLRGEHLNGDKTLKMIFRQLCGQSRNGSCPDVERVLLSDGCRITDKGLQLLTRRCPELTHLQLHFCVNVTNQALIDVLTKCTNLQHLDVTGCSQVNTISPNPNLEPPRRLLLQYLDLTDCIAIDDVGLKIVVKNCPQLIYLYLRRCVQITDAGLKFVPSFCIALKELSVSDCVKITDFGLYELAKLGAALRYLSVAKCDRVSDAGLKVIARRCYKLRYLNTRGCEAVSDDSITVLARSCPRLRALDIGKCDVSDAGLRALAESCPNLKKLSLRNCDMITDRGVQCVAYYCRGLQQLNIQDCQISIEGYRAVKKYCKRCVIEHTNPGFC